MTLLSSKHDFTKDLERIRSLSSKIDTRLANAKIPEDETIDKLTLDELQDLTKILGIADFMLCKYADKKEMHSILKYFSSIVSETADSLDKIDDEISELIISAEDSIGKVKDMRTRISEKSDFKTRYDDGPDYNAQETSPINLTSFATEINTLEYQQNPKGCTT